MKSRFLLCVLFVLLLPAAIAAKDSWTNVRSKNFNLVGNAAEKDIRRVAGRLEQFRETFRQIFPRANFNSFKNTNVVVFKTDKDFRPFKPVRADGNVDDWVAGYFQAGDDSNYIAISTEGDDRQTFQIIFHEYVHFIIDNNYGRAAVPPWFNEGLAEYYQTFRLENDREAHLGEIHEHFLRLLKEQPLMPFDKFFAVDYFTLHNQGNHGKTMFYAQSWALLHYLQQGNKGARRAQLSKFLALLLQNKLPRDAFAEAFQTDYATMEKELKKYVEQRTFNGTIITLKDKLTFDAAMKTAPLTDGESNAYLGDLLLHTNRLSEAETRLNQAIALDADNALAHAALGMTLVRQKRHTEAKTYLEKAVALNTKSYLPHFYYAFALEQEERDSLGFVRRFVPAKAAKIRELLDKAIELNPKFADSYRLRAFVNLVNDEKLDEAIVLLEKAVALDAGNENYQLDLAHIYLRQENFDAARSLARKVFNGANDSAMRGNAQVLLSTIDNYELRLKEAQNINERPDRPDAPPALELSVEEALNQSLNEALRKLRTGENRVVGFLTAIQCEPKSILFSVRTDKGETLKLKAADFQTIIFTAFTESANNRQINCGSQKTEDFVVVTFKPKPEGKSNGEIIAVEFVPPEFRLQY